MEDIYEVDSSLVRRKLAYQKETMAIKRKIKNGVPSGKKEKIEFRLQDIKERLLPKLIGPY